MIGTVTNILTSNQELHPVKAGRSLSAVFLSIIILILAVNVLGHQAWKRSRIIYSDTFSYYAYLPATFIEKDLKLQFLDHDRQSKFNDLWYSTSETGVRFTKMAIGWSVMNMPFFLLAHGSAKMLRYDADGFSLPYQVAICLATLFYICMALVILRKILLNYFSERAVAITLVLLVFATNLYHYTVFEPGMTHPINFFLFSSFLWLTIRWHKNTTIGNSILLGLVVGLITVTRASNLLVVLVFPLYGVTGMRSLVGKVILLFGKARYLFLAAGVAFLVFVPQMLYWNLISGHLIYYSYLDEHFFFSHPQLLRGLVGFRKGWLVYTPVMILALAVLFRMKQAKAWSAGIGIFVVLNIYVILSWWCWWYGGSFGARSFIESYALLSLPLASFVNQALAKKYVSIMAVVLLTFFIFLNVFQTIQYKKGRIHYDSMTRQAYRAVFLKDETPPEWESLICHPDYYNAKLGIPERTDCTGHDHNNP